MSIPRPTVETREHQAASRQLLTCFLAALGMETPIKVAAAETGIPANSLKRWCNDECSLPAKYHATVAEWIERRMAVRE